MVIICLINTTDCLGWWRFKQLCNTDDGLIECIQNVIGNDINTINCCENLKTRSLISITCFVLSISPCPGGVHGPPGGVDHQQAMNQQQQQHHQQQQAQHHHQQHSQQQQQQQPHHHQKPQPVSDKSMDASNSAIIGGGQDGIKDDSGHHDWTTTTQAHTRQTSPLNQQPLNLNGGQAIAARVFALTI